MRSTLKRLGGVLLLAGVLGCGDDNTGPNPPPDPDGVKPDFSLRDVNPNSATYDHMVSPRHYLGSISAFYFASAT